MNHAFRPVADNALKKLDEIEAEMRRIGWWSDAPELGAGVCANRFRSFVDAPTLRIWVQALFLPNARAAAIDRALPARSQASEIIRRQYGAEANAAEARKLVGLIGEFDQLCHAAAAS